jgi:STE24 endopeptidase
MQIERLVAVKYGGLPSVVVVLSVFVYLVKALVNARQAYKFTETEIPLPLRTIVTPAEFEKSQKYNFDCITLGMLKDHLGLGEEVIGYTFGYLALMWNYSADFAGYFGFDGEIAISVVVMFFAMMISMFSDVAYGLYATFVIEERYDFNKTTLRLFITDCLKEMVIEGVMTGFCMAGVLWIT